MLYVNGISRGVTAEGIPPGVYGVFNLYGRCAQVSVVPNEPECERIFFIMCYLYFEFFLADTSCMISSVELISPISLACAMPERPDRLRFHSRHGILVRLSSGGRTAERLRPLDEFNNGVVMTHRPLLPDELFEVGFFYTNLY